MLFNIKSLGLVSSALICFVDAAPTHGLPELHRPAQIDTFNGMLTRQNGQTIIPNAIVQESIHREPALPEGFQYVTEINENSNDINDDFGGDYSYITYRTGEVGSDGNEYAGFTIEHKYFSVVNETDVTKLPVGYHRHLIPQMAGPGDEVVSELALWRSSILPSHSAPPTGYEGWHMSTDINKDRGRSYLYLLWKTVSVVSQT